MQHRASVTQAWYPANGLANLSGWHDIFSTDIVSFVVCEMLRTQLRVIFTIVSGVYFKHQGSQIDSVLKMNWIQLDAKTHVSNHRERTNSPLNSWLTYALVSSVRSPYIACRLVSPSSNRSSTTTPRSTTKLAIGHVSHPPSDVDYAENCVGLCRTVNDDTTDHGLRQPPTK